MPAERCVAFAPGRVNLIGEHTDYNQGLALPFAIREGVTVQAQATTGSPARIRALASDLGESDELPVDHPSRTEGWRAFVRGVVAELTRAGLALPSAQLAISGQVPRGAGLSSSAAMEVALCLALIGLCTEGPGAVWSRLDRTEIARLCARVENDWVGAQTGLLDQLACLYGAPDTALLIDFRSLSVQPVPFVLGDWRLVVLDSGERHRHASSGYNERRRECERACELLGVRSLREVDLADLTTLPELLRRRATHVLRENRRVRAATSALSADDMPALGRLLDASHESLRDCYEVSTPAVEKAVKQLLNAGAAGARLIGGGFGGSVLGLFAPGTESPVEAREVRPGAGAHLLAS
ncbi:MAG: galactokinase family protein [Solirubrobacteraceae bacterium]